MVAALRDGERPPVDWVSRAEREQRARVRREQAERAEATRREREAAEREADRQREATEYELIEAHASTADRVIETMLSDSDTSDFTRRMLAKRPPAERRLHRFAREAILAAIREQTTPKPTSQPTRPPARSVGVVRC